MKGAMAASSAFENRLETEKTEMTTIADTSVDNLRDLVHELKTRLGKQELELAQLRVHRVPVDTGCDFHLRDFWTT